MIMSFWLSWVKLPGWRLRDAGTTIRRIGWQTLWSGCLRDDLKAVTARRCAGFRQHGAVGSGPRYLKGRG